MMDDFLPVSKKEIKSRGWDYIDFVLVSGDAYVDNSSFGTALIGRVLESHGYRVGIIAQPDWTDENSIAVLGEPRFGFMVSAGNMDSMVNHYTSLKKKRTDDAYSPGGKIGLRPDYATIVYCNLIKRKYKKKPVIIGGIEASLRRLAHYDYWQDKVRRSILLDSGADILVYGMGELSSVEIADALSSGIAVEDITFIRGTVFKSRDVSGIDNIISLHDYDEIKESKRKYAESFRVQFENLDFMYASPLAEKYGENRFVVQNPPQRILTEQEMDDIYELPFMNECHPMYKEKVPALQEVQFSLTSSRGCFGGCNFCSLVFHQGRVVQSRSHESLIREATNMTHHPNFKGYIHDVGGPTANFRHPACEKQKKNGACKNRQCLFPDICNNVDASHRNYIDLLKKLRVIPGVKKVFIRSGIRFDYMLCEKNDTFFRELCEHHISGQLRVAPEHVSDNVLYLMGKPSLKVYERFINKFNRINNELGKKQYAVPYLISSHPGSRLSDAVMLAEYIRDMGYMPEQIQDFYPTPSTVSTCMYYTGINPLNMEKVYVPKGHEKLLQRALIQYRNPENYGLVKEALLKAGRHDLIGFDKKICLIMPRKIEKKEKAEIRRKYNKYERKKIGKCSERH